MAKFRCKDENCLEFGIKKEIISYRIIIDNLGKRYVNPETGEVFLCEGCGRVLQFIEEEKKGFCTNFSTFNSKSMAEKQDILRKRNREHDKRDNQLHERKQALDRGETKY